MKDEKPSHLGHRKRVRDKFLASMGKELHDYEILEILLFNVFPRSDTKPLAKRLLAKFGDISGVVNADVNLLKMVDGIGESAIVALKINAEITSRVLKIKAKEGEFLENYEAVLNYARSALANLNHEVFRVIFLDKSHKIIEDELLATGENDFVQINVKDVARKALLLHCEAVILMHNHPTSDLKPSKADIKITSQICEVLKSLNIMVLDHFIIGKTGYFSFKEEGIL
jgi:DNA repair protein RadC